MSPRDKPIVWLSGEVRSPPFSADARIEAGFLLRRLQRGESLGMPHSRPMPTVGPGCHELRIVDGAVSWRLMYHVAPSAIVMLAVFPKKTAATPAAVIAECRKRLALFQRVMRTGKGKRDAR